MKKRDPAGWRKAAIRAGWPETAATYHSATRAVPIRHGATAERYDAFLEHRATVEASPSPFKPTSGRGRTLPTASYASEFPTTLLARRTWRGFGTRPVSARALGTLLDLTFGCQMNGQRQGVNVQFRTSPSGGNCHPIEAYLLVRNVASVAPGLYHYSPGTGRIYLLDRGATSALVEEYLGHQPWFAGAGVVALMTAVMPRVWWRYPHARSYRAVLLEAGHFCQTWCLVATWLGLAPFSTMALDDARIERDLRIDGRDEILLYAAGAGTRPSHGRWVQWPGHIPDVALPLSRRGRSSR